MKNTYVVILIIAIVVISLFLYMHIQSIKGSLEKIKIREKQINGSLQALNNEIENLKEKIHLLEIRFNQTILAQRKTIKELNNSLNDFEALLQERIQWIKKNSNIGNVVYYRETKDKIRKCYDGSINLGCIWFLIHDRELIDYITERKDQLTDLETIYKKKGGDCEDLSLVFAATARYAMEKYNATSFTGWVNDQMANFIIYETPDTKYYVPHAKPHSFFATKIYEVCYLNLYTGHCIVAFCPKNVSEKGFESCTFIEPQEYGHIVSIPKNISFFISDNDLCLIINSSKQCFSDFAHKIEQIKSTYQTSFPENYTMQ